MGSGHFLVNTTHAVANLIVEFLNETPWENQDIDTDVATWRRRVAERCIFGVDLNELAVELAKLCLWMTTAAKGKPLTFLDHHLRWGNSLVGAWMQDVGVYPLAKERDEPAFTLPLGSFQVALDQVLAGYQELYARDSDDVEEVRQKARIYDQKIRPMLERYRELFDLHTGVYFGHGLDETTYARLGASVHVPEAWTETKAHLKLEELVENYRAQRWFHWELEFPEVFAGARKGFDGVVGNPPYVRQEYFSDQKSFLQGAFDAVYGGAADLYVYFIAQGIKALASDGRLGFITSNKWLRAGYAASLREALPRLAQPVEILDFGHSDVFPGTDTFPCILIMENRDDGEREDLRFADVSDRVRGATPLHEYIAGHSFSVPMKALRREGWLLEPSGTSRLLRRLQTEFPRLGKHLAVDALFGIKTGFDEAFCISTPTRDQLLAADPTCHALLRKLLRGRHIRRWRPAWVEDWMITIPSSANRDWPWSHCQDDQAAEEAFRATYPVLHAHLKLYEAELRRRQDQGRFWWELRSCDYYDALERPKIVVQQILYHSVFALDTEGSLVNAKVYSLTSEDLWLLGVLNSRLIWWYIYRVWPHMKDEALAVQKPGLLALPIPRTTPDVRTRIEALVRDALALANQPSSMLLEIERQLNACVLEAYGLSASEIAMMEQTLPPRDPLEVLERQIG
jgi:hypothetical protein